MSFERDIFEIEREIYHTQWNNIRQHWEQTFSAVKYLSSMVLLAIIPLKFLRISEGTSVQIALDPEVTTYLKVFVITIILLMGMVTFLNQYNHHTRSKEARKVVVAIEKRWGLYDEHNRFIFQEAGSKIDYAKFAGRERRLTQAKVVFTYIVIVTIAGILFVCFA
jgi:hypothetical protein